MERLSCQACHSQQFLNPLYDNRMCISCITSGVERATGQTAHAVLAAIPAEERGTILTEALQWAARNALVPKARSATQPPAPIANAQRPPVPEAPFFAQVDAQRQDYRKHLKWCERIAGVEPRDALLALLIAAIQMHRLFRRYLHRPGAPCSWSELERRAPGATIVWLTWLEVWRVGYLAIGSPFVYEARSIVEQMCTADNPSSPHRGTDRPQERCRGHHAQWMHSDHGDLELNPRLGRALDRDRGGMTRWEALCERLPGSVVHVWHEQQWQTLSELRTAVARDIEHGGVSPRPRGRPRKQAQHIIVPTERYEVAEQGRRVAEAFENVEELRQRIARTRAKLSPRQRDILDLLPTHTRQEIADVFGISKGAVDKQIDRLYKKMRRAS